MKKQRFSLLSVLVLSMLVILIFGCTAPPDAQLKSITQQIQKAVQAELDSMDNDLLATAAALSQAGLSGDGARSILNGLTQKHAIIIDSCAIDTAGIMVTCSPQTYNKYEGSDVSRQDVMVAFYKEKKPMLSKVFTSVEGIDSVIIIAPILSAKGDFTGSLSMLFEPQALFAATAEPILKGTDVIMNVMQLDGLTIYDSEYADVGLNLLTDPAFKLYPELVDFGRKIAGQKSGVGGYTFINHATSETVKKEAYWETAGLHGTEWRLVSIKVAD
jgi:hypothetical protein